MESTKRLRDWLQGRLLLGNGWNELSEIADNIEREADAVCDERDHWMELAHQWEDGASTRRFAERLELAASERADVTIFGVDYTPLPLDADGIPIHVGDVMEVGNGRRDEVRFLTLNENGWAFNDKGWVPSWSHHRATTVEDVLREFADEVQRCCDTADTIAEYAAKLRLAGDE